MHSVCCVMLYVLAGDVMCMNNFSKCFGNEILKISLGVFWVWICGYVGLPSAFMIFQRPGQGGRILKFGIISKGEI